MPTISTALTATDGTQQKIVIDITGTEDAPVVTGTFTGKVTEGNLGDVATATGTITISDVDNGDDPIFANTTVTGTYGELALVDGKWTYTLDQSQVQQLDEGDRVQDTITLTATDGTQQNIVIDITGTEDAPVVTGTFTGSVPSSRCACGSMSARSDNCSTGVSASGRTSLSGIKTP